MGLVSSGQLCLGSDGGISADRSVQAEFSLTSTTCLATAFADTSVTGTCLSDFYGQNAGTQPTPGPVINNLANAQQIRTSTFISDGGTLSIPANFWVWSDSTSTAALIVDTPNATIMNSGNIIGRGGDAGAAGGHAIEITACGVTIINNSGAFIAGGGGGGGFRVTDLGRGRSVGGGGGAGGGRGGNGSSGAGGAGGVIGANGSQGGQAGGPPGAGTQGGGGGGGRILPGTSTSGGSGVGGGGGQVGTVGGGGGWGAAGGEGSSDRRFGGAGGAAGPAIISSVIWNGLTNNGTVFGLVAPTLGSGTPIGGLFHHQQVTLSSLCVDSGDTVTIPSNFFFWSDDTAVAALTIDVNNVTLINNGSIIGRGGNGGGGAQAGGDGGPAINVTASGVTITNNSTGFIGGGGGGGSGRTVNRGRGTFNGGGGGAGGGFGGAGSSSNSRATVSIPGAIGQPGISGAQTGGGGNSGTNYGAGGGRVTPGAAYTATTGGGGGWGQPGVANGGAGGDAGAAITGTVRTINNSGDIRGSNTALLISGSCSTGVVRSPRGCSTTIPFSGTVPAGAQWSINVNSSGSSDPRKTGSLVFDGVTVATFTAGAGGTPGSFFRSNSYSGTGTITGGPYTPTTVTFSVSGAGSSLPGTSNAHIGGSVTLIG